jgi:hypothetical protein
LVEILKPSVVQGGLRTLPPEARWVPLRTKWRNLVFAMRL